MAITVSIDRELELEREIKRLREALAPFVAAANDAEGYPNSHPIGCDPCMPLEGLTVGHLRRAWAASQSSAKLHPDDHQ